MNYSHNNNQGSSRVTRKTGKPKSVETDLIKLNIAKVIFVEIVPKK